MNNHNAGAHRRCSIRLKDYDYSQAGYYFVTLCTKDRLCVFGNISGEKLHLSAIGNIVSNYWTAIPDHFEKVALDEFVIMPSHLHGILLLNCVGVQYIEPLLRHEYQHIIPKSLGSIIRSYKSAVSRTCRKNGFQHFQWQRNYYEHIVRSEEDLKRIREYIINNPLSWSDDEYNPANMDDRDTWRNEKEAHNGFKHKK